MVVNPHEESSHRARRAGLYLTLHSTMILSRTIAATSILPALVLIAKLRIYRQGWTKDMNSFQC
jgi:hypothetical protein